MTDPDHARDVPVLTIDGPSGSGKGTIGQSIATAHGWHFLDSGAMYRVVALAALDAGVDFSDVDRLVEIARDSDIRFLPRVGATAEVILNGDVVSERLRTEEAGAGASKVAAEPRVREALLQRQRDFRRAPGLVADGRDMGTTVFPQATLKIFLTASAEERAQRRYKQLKEKGFSVNLARLLGEIRQRDERDSTRSASPLRPAEDAIEVDTTGVGIDEVVDRIEQLLSQRLSG
jgi:cytidylate kinase